MKAIITLLIIATALIGAAPAAGHVTDPDSGRDVYLGDWAGLVRCESLGDADEYNHVTGIASGLFQFLPSTWDGIALESNRHRLVGLDPATVGIHRQLKQAVRLRDRYSIYQWECWRYYGTGSPWVTVYDEPVTPRNPKRCTRHLSNYVTRRIARSVCDHPNAPVRS